MHWCAYPSPTHCLIQAKKQNKSADISQNKSANISQPVLSSFLLQNASVSQTQKHRWTSMGAKLAIR